MKTIVIYETYDLATHIQNKTSQNKQKESKKKNKQKSDEVVPVVWAHTSCLSEVMRS
jgi:hypothetical protein